ncbi:MAG: Y-family DNA polymerase [Bdellovibrionaceae bacterium]|nr:Y-family DNA polymerase [Pseudobdellovibrionaceae bacterium]
MSSPVFALVDCNSFYCSCERVFRPDLLRKPVIVLSNNDGCVVSRTDEAKALGIKMGEPFFKVKDLCEKNHVTVFSSNYALYGDMSRRVMRTLSDFTPEMEIYSIDEAFLSLDGFKKDTITNYALSIQQKVLKNTGIPVSIGVGPTKVLAKAANHYAKKNKQKTNGVVNTFEWADIDFLLKQIPVEDVWGIGKKSAEKLKPLKIKTACDLKYANERVVERILTVVGRRIVEELRGSSCLSLESDLTDKKQIVSSRSFGRSVYTLAELKEAVATHVSNAAEKLRKQNSLAHSILVFVHTNRFKNTAQYHNSALVRLRAGTSVTHKLIGQALAALENIYRPGFEYKKAGVVLMDLTTKSSTQLDFFSTFDSAKDDNLMKTLDLINEREGKGTLKFAACGIDPDWKMLSKMKSPHYTTRWADLIQV